MLPYLVGRVLQAILSMLVVISIVFVLARLSGNPVHLLLDVNATQQDVDTFAGAVCHLREKYRPG